MLRRFRRYRLIPVTGQEISLLYWMPATAEAIQEQLEMGLKNLT